ncbi:MAG: family 16 glycosylhydrolase [Granulosicoccus sp.]
MNRIVSRIRCTTAVFGFFAVSTASFMAVAASPSAPGLPSGSVGNNTVTLQWAPSQDDNEVRGYNVYVNDDYYATVFETSYTGSVDTSQDNAFYITAFDTPLPGEERAFSTRSPVLVLERFDTVQPVDDPPLDLPPNDDPPNEDPPDDRPTNDDPPDDIPPNDGPSGDIPDTTAPSTPTGLTLVSAVSNAIAISWAPSTDDTGVVGYNIHRAGDYYATVFTTRFVDDNPLSDAANNYSVVAFDDARNYTPRSRTLSIMAPGTGNSPENPSTPPVTSNDISPPSTPDGLSVVLETRDAVRLGWNPSTDDVAVDGYNVYFNGAYTATVFTTTFVVSAPEPGTEHAYAISAFDSARNYSGISEEIVLGETTDPEPTDPEPTDPKPSNPDPEPPLDDSGELVPVLDPNNRFPSPDPNDPFGSLLEIDTEAAEPGGPPTTPKNLRIDLVSNDWAEFSWAPANDDVGVVAYNIYRDDGVIYRIKPELADVSAGAQAEIDKYWNTTSFIDCNFTRFDRLIHNCRENQPEPGETYVYQVSAVDAEGGESPLSDPLSITYHEPENAPVPIFDDFYKMPDDRFAQSNDLSQTRFFLDEFDLVFNDEFETPSVDPTKWQTELRWRDSTIINGEQQYFVRTQDNPEFGYDPFTLDGDNLTINAVPVPEELRQNLPPVCDEVDPTGKDRCEFLSGALSSHNRFSFIYGYVEGRMKVSATPGALSSFYLYHRYKGTGVNLHAPEIDIVEYLGENPFGAEDAFQTYHFDDVSTGVTRSAPTMSYSNPSGELYSEEFHTFGVLWEPQLVIWYIDGREVKRMTGPMVSRQPMNIVQYLVAGSVWAPTPDISNPDIFPMEFGIDYVRVYQREVYQGTARFGGGRQ